MEDVFHYKCWKCRRSWTVHQEEPDELALDCPRCGRKLFQCNVAPNIQTDSTFMSGVNEDDGFGTDNRSRMLARAKAKAAGVNPDGKRYCPSLAKERHDPEAWISGKGDVKRICAKRGLGCETFGIKAPIDDSPDPHEKPYRVADQVVDREVRKQRILRGDDFTASERNRLREETRERLTGTVEV